MTNENKGSSGRYIVGEIVDKGRICGGRI